MSDKTCPECGEPLGQWFTVRTRGLPVVYPDGRREEPKVDLLHPNCRAIADIDVDHLSRIQVERLRTMDFEDNMTAAKVAAALTPP